MSSTRLSRRDFVKGSLSVLAAASLPATMAFGQTAIRIRQEWNEFRASPNYSSFIDAIRMMRANTNAADPNSWRYWTNVHVNYCPHEIAYFLAWHRGYIYYFERQLQLVSGNPNLALPYWNYYQNTRMPAEFTDPAAGNPLYVTGRVNTNVATALSLTPFGSTVWNFERGRVNAFEPLIESRPHNPVHNLIGGVMRTMESPMDPIFYVHHANIDRLWHAWALPNGKGMPWVSSPYWSGSFTYSPSLTLARLQCYHPSRLGNAYSDYTVPTSFPPQTQSARIIRVQAQGPATPGGDTFPAIPAGPAADGGRRVGGARRVSLAENTVRIRVPVMPPESQAISAIASAEGARAAGRPVPSAPYKSVQVVLDGVQILEAGVNGGYYYNLFLTAPERGDPSSDRNFIGTLGPFEVAAASHHGPARLTLPATAAIGAIGADNLTALSVTIERVSGANSPRGKTIEIGEVRIEVSAAEPYDTSPLVTKPENEPFR